MATLNLNTFPYYDDFNGEKGFHRILFKPGYAVQARELTQLQTILQEQIKRFGNHIFKDGSVIFGCAETTNFNVPYIKVLDTDNNSEDISNTTLSAFEGKVLVGGNESVKAVIKKAVTGSEGDSPNLKTLYLQYTATGTDNTTTVFGPGEILTVEGTTDTFVVADISETPAGEGALFSVGAGIVYANGAFVVNDPQTIVISKYATNPTAKVGFIVDEQIISFIDDETLLDPAQGTFNFTAPGADRYKLVPTLTSYTSTQPEGFYILFDVEDGSIKRKYNTSQYAELNKTLARRTYDESGDYTVRTFPLIIREHLSNGTNNGRYTALQGGNAGKLAIGVEPGKGYVKGYEHELFATEYIPVDKAIDTQTQQNQAITTAYGNYVTVTSVSGSWPINSYTTVALKNSSAATIGTARVRAFEYVSSGTYRLYLYDITMSTGAFSAVTTITSTNATATVSAAGLENSSFTPLIFESTYKNLDAVADASYVYRKVITGQTCTSGAVTVTLASEAFAFSTATITDVIIVNQASVYDYKAFTSGTVVGNTLTLSGVGGTFTGTVTVMALVRNTTATQNAKTLRKNRYVKINTNTHGTGATGPYTLGLYDVISVSEIWAANHTESYVADPSVNPAWTNVTSSFVVDNGQRDSKYDLATITPKSTYNATNKKLIVKLDYFEHATTSPYYTVDSYPLPAVNSAPSSSQIEWYDLPKYTSVGGTVFNLRDCIDFRPTVTATASDSTTVSGGTENPSAGSSLISGFVFPAPTEEFIGDLTYFLPRIDRIILNTDGVFSAIKGVPQFDPVRPREPDNAMTLGYVYIAPYPSLSPYVATQISNNEYTCRVTLVDNRRFTMRDIGEIHRRIDRLEYYTSLSLLEQNTANLLIANSAGEDRFKNGILVDSFVGHNIGNVFDASYNCSIADGNLRPFFTLENIDFEYTSGTNIVRKASDAIIVVRQTVGAASYIVGSTVTSSSTATGTILHNVELGRDSTYKWVRLYLNGVSGTFATNNTITSGAVTGTITYTGITDAVIPTALRPSTVVVPATGNLVTLPYTHKIYSQNTYASKTRNAVSQLLISTYTGTMNLSPAADIWTDTQVLPAVQVNAGGTADNWEFLESAWGTQWGNWEALWQGVQTETINFGNGISDTTSTTTQRQQRTGTGIDVSTTTITNNLGTRVVSATLIPFMRSRVVAVNATRLKPNTQIYAFFDGIDVSQHVRPTGGAYGDDLLVDASGNFTGDFRIPANTFNVGTKSFVLCDNSTNPNAANMKTFAISSFTASGLGVVERGTIISTQVPQITQTRQTQTQDVVVSRITQRTVTQPEITQFPDPIAQTFYVTDNVNGIVLTKIDLFFQKKSTTAPITLEIREVSNGYPSEIVVPYSTVTLLPKDINVSDDGSKPTEFKFSEPVYLKNDTEYCFVLLPAGNDDNYEVWVSELGENEIGTTNRIDKQPASGVLFVSGNNRTWNAIQTEDIKYSIYRAEFNDSLTGQLVVTNTPVDYVTVPDVSSISVGDTVLFKTGGTTNATGVVKYLDTKNKELKVEISSGTAGAGNDVVIGSTVVTTVTSINNKIVNSLAPTLGYLDFNNTNTIWEYKIHSTAGVDPVSYTTLSAVGTTDLFDEKKVFANSSIVDTFVMRANLNSDADNISPIIDLNKIGCVVVANYTNNVITNETTNTGSAYSKYISRKVVLDNGQEAEDLRIYLTADLPAGSSVKVYAKLLNDTDTATFTSRPWVLMTETAPINTVGFKEYYYTLPAGGTTTAAGGLDAGTGVYTYSTNYKGFKTFAVKIVLLSTSTSIVPLVRDMRAIALQV
jgi:hypothetical protein